MTIKILLVLVGFALIIFGADVLVDGTSNIAKNIAFLTSLLV
jgi:cation:H+ antiporter